MRTFTRKPPQKTIEQLLNEVPALDETDSPLGEQVRAAKARLVQLRELLPTLREKREQTIGRSVSPEWVFRESEVRADAAALVEGEDIGTLDVTTTHDARGTLNRQLAAVQAAITMAEQRLRDLRQRLQNEELAGMNELRHELGHEVVAAYEDLRDTLQRVQDAYRTLHSRGFDHMLCVGTPFSLADFDRQLLNGGGGRPTLDWWVQNRRRVFGLPADERKRKAV